MDLVPYFLLVTLTQLVTGTLVTGSPPRRWSAVALATFALAIPWIVPPDPPWVRSLIALGFVMTFLRTLDLAKEKRERSLLFRILHVAIPFDTRRVTPAPRGASIAAIAKMLLYFALFWVAMHVAREAGPASIDRPGPLAIRWLAGAVLAYAVTDSAYRFAECLVRGAGFDLYELHRHPIASLSVKEFWGERWNRTVMAWFREHLVRPLAKRRAIRLGVLASFTASALLHAYLVIVSISVVMAAVMFGYFILQALLVFFEMATHMDRHNRMIRRVWTLGVMIATSPLFVEPGLRVLGI